MRLAWEEPFGPVLPVIRISRVEEGIHHCNPSTFGLQGCVFTKDINKAIMISDAMETGTVQINSAPSRGPDHFPFQGLKDSGIGSQGITNSIMMMTKVNQPIIFFLYNGLTTQKSISVSHLSNSDYHIPIPESQTTDN
eukprot:TRINITY_DN3354_c0_g1_i1.p2 TRINITY_DN3354_c0_g1~~TRINITY_DN3354_c0_g1_i1.p2  ORF type:complete len:138 (+),score=10.55 TRINITY_DN3354_c0_g1_i1:1376-1789(+)